LAICMTFGSAVEELTGFTSSSDVS
jgi:hypothetical protein